MMKTKLACLASATALAVGGVAQGQISYNYLELGYAFSSTEIEGLGDLGDGNGFSFGLSYSPMQNFFGFANGDWTSLSDLDDATTFDLQLGVGAYYPIASAIDLVGRASWKFSSFDITDVEGFSDLEDDSGAAFDVGLRAMLGPQFELGAFVGWESVGDIADGAAIDVYGLYHFSPQLGIGASGVFGDSSDGFRAFLRYNF